MNWLIINDNERDDNGHPLYWNNDNGWVPQAQATKFTDDERHGKEWFLPLGGRWISEFDFECHDEQADVTFTPWTDGWAVGYRCMFPDGHVEYIYMNPSSDGGGDPAHRPTVFVYHGTDGDSAQDPPCHYYDVGALELPTPDDRYTGRTFWHDGICWLATREAPGAARPTITSMDGRHSLDWTWAQVAQAVDGAECPQCGALYGEMGHASEPCLVDCERCHEPIVFIDGKWLHTNEVAADDLTAEDVTDLYDHTATPS